MEVKPVFALNRTRGMFRCGEPARVTGVFWVKNDEGADNLCVQVEFGDGTVDYLPLDGEDFATEDHIRPSFSFIEEERWEPTEDPGCEEHIADPHPFFLESSESWYWVRETHRKPFEAAYNVKLPENAILDALTFDTVKQSSYLRFGFNGLNQPSFGRGFSIGAILFTSAGDAMDALSEALASDPKVFTDV